MVLISLFLIGMGVAITERVEITQRQFDETNFSNEDFDIVFNSAKIDLRSFEVIVSFNYTTYEASNRSFIGVVGKPFPRLSLNNSSTCVAFNALSQ